MRKSVYGSLMSRDAEGSPNMTATGFLYTYDVPGSTCLDGRKMNRYLPRSSKKL